MSIKRFNIITLSAFAIIMFNTCNMPMGMGPAVDTTPPMLWIDDVHRNKVLGKKYAGDSIELSGTWEDDIGVTLMRAEITDIRGKLRTTDEFGEQKNFIVDFVIEKEIGSISAVQRGTWTAKISIPNPEEWGEAELSIKMVAIDDFGLKGAAFVIVKVDIVAPWIDKVWIDRHPDYNGVIRFTQDQYKQNQDDDKDKKELFPKSYYDEFIDFNKDDSYRSISKAAIDSFQNESFTVKIQLSSNLSGVASARLLVFDGDGKRLNNGSRPGVEDKFGLIPSSNKTTDKVPAWDITAELLESWNPDYASGPHYISFEVWVWNGAEWEGGYIDGHPKYTAIDTDGSVTDDTVGTVNIRKIGGTCWFPESDRPLFSVRNERGGHVLITSADSLEIEVYEDDSLSQIYAALLEKIEYEKLVFAFDPAGTKRNIDYHEYLRTNEEAREDFINNHAIFKPKNEPGDEDTKNWFSESGVIGNRGRIVNLHDHAEGDYFLVVLAEDKTVDTEDYPKEKKWGVNAPLSVLVKDDQEQATIYVNNPIRENVFPDLDNFRTFKIEGNTLDLKGINSIQIAWIPDGVDSTRVDEAFTSAVSRGINQNGAAYIEHEIHVWNLNIDSKEETINYGAEYYQDNFEKEFDIVNDFMVKPDDDLPQNSQKNFIIRAVNKSNMSTKKDFKLASYHEKPVINMLNPLRNNFGHAYDTPLTLQMQVNPKKTALVLPPKITYLDGSEAGVPFIPSLSGSTYQYTKDYSDIEFYEVGGSRKIRYEVSDILGNTASLVWDITMVASPELKSITSSNAAGTYGEGEILYFEAEFSKPVTVKTGTPRLKLYFTNPLSNPPVIDPGVNGFYAEYTQTGSGGDTVRFAYTIPVGVTAGGLYTYNVPFDLTKPDNIPFDFANGIIEDASTGVDGGDVKTNLPGANDGLPFKKSIAIDSVRPEISSVSFTQNTTAVEGISYFGKRDTVFLELVTDKPMRVSGSPTAQINYSTNADPAVVKSINADFSSITTSGNSSTLFFAYTIPDSFEDVYSPLSWNKTIGSLSTITDLNGNILDLSNTLSAGVLNGTAANKQAYLVTADPPVPAVKFFKGPNGTGGEHTPKSDGVIRHNGTVYLRVTTNVANTTLYYTKDGVTGIKVTDDVNTNGDILLTGDNTYFVTAYQIDKKGKRSNNTATQEIIINSSPPTLSRITTNVPNNTYGSGETISFTLHFSRQITVESGARVTLTIKDWPITTSPASSSVTLSLLTPAESTGTKTTTLTGFNWTVGNGLYMKNIRIDITFNGSFVDEFGNSFTANNNFHLQQDELIIDSKGPVIETYSPGKPVAGASPFHNGYVIGGNAIDGISVGDNLVHKITLTFDENVNKVSGDIIIRPYGEWAVPPVMSNADFDKLYYSNFYNNGGLSDTPAANSADFRKRLKSLNESGIEAFPIALTSMVDHGGNGGTTTTTDVYSPDVRDNILTERNKYNHYEYTTRGLTTGTSIRPDTTEKWVLAFRHDIYKGVDALREVFNAARWNWQIISVASGNVNVSGKTVTIDLLQLPKGRIWEVIIPAGAFQDDGKNPSVAVNAGDYRFWSDGVAAPVIRADKYSHGEHFHGIFDERNNFTSETNMPNIDTPVRIDCETPGATIRYNVLRTYYAPTAAAYNASNPSSGSSKVFTERYSEPFFGHANASGNFNYFNNNTIGNGSGNVDSNGYFTGLLVPNTVTTGSATLVNGAVNALPSPTGTGSKIYNDSSTFKAHTTVMGRMYNFTTDSATTASGEAITSTGHFIYIGDAYSADNMNSLTLDSRKASRVDDPRLYTGRRDYVVADAVKNSHSASDNTAGPQLNGGNASSTDREGVFKTTVLHRRPAAIDNTAMLIIKGFDKPTTSTVAGFPLNDLTVFFPPNRSYYWDYFSRRFYRNGSNYIWVSWEIVTDWYHKGHIWANPVGAGANGAIDRNGYNYNSILATYGAVTYRYEQRFVNTGDGGTQ